MARRGVQHWKKRKAIAAYLFRRRGLGKFVTLSDVLTFSEQVAIEGIGNYVRFFTDSIGMQEDLVLTSGFTKDDLLGISESISKSLVSNKEELISFSENFSSKFSTLNSESIELDEQLDLLFNLNPAADSVSFTEDFNKAIVKALSDGFFLDDSAAIDKDVYTDKSNALSFTEDFTYVIFRLITQSLGPDYLNLTEDQRKSLIKPFYEELSFEELATLLVNLNKEENIGLSDLIAFGTSKPLDDSLPLSEQVILLLGLNTSEQLTFTEYSNLTLLKRVVDGFALDDSAAIDKDVYKDKSNVITFTETVDKVIFRILDALTPADSLDIGDSLKYKFSSSFLESYSVSDSLLFGLSSPKVETLTFTDSSFYKVNKTLSDIFTLDDISKLKDVDMNKSNAFGFEELLALTTSLTKTDSTTLNDSTVYNVNKTLSDTVTLDDVSQLKDVDMNKSNVLGLEETFGLKLTKSFTEYLVMNELNDKQIGIIKTDDLIVSHNTGDVAMDGDFSDRKLGGEPFNNITFN